MIEKLHRYRTLLVLGLILVAAAFVFGDFYGGRRNSGGGARSVLGVAGKTYDTHDFHKLADGPVALAQAMMRMGDYAPYMFVFSLAKGGDEQTSPAEKFFVGRVILRNARDEYGIHPSDEEVSAFIRKMQAFAGAPAQGGAPGAFDEKKYRDFIDKTLPNARLTENDFLDFATDMLAQSKLKSILAAGVTPDKEEVAKKKALEKQTISLDLARLDLGPFEDKIQPTEDEIKGYWEPIKDSFKTEERRKFTYLLVTPVFPPDPSAEPAPKETIAEAAATEEAKAAAKKKREEEQLLKKAKYDDERRAVQNYADGQVDEFIGKLDENIGKPGGKSLEEIVAEYVKINADVAKANDALPKDQSKQPLCKWELKSTDLFTLAAAPAEVDLPLRATGGSRGKSAAELFRIHPANEEISKYSPPLPVGEGQWLVARLDGEEPVREMTYAEARAAARAKFIEEKAIAELKKTATEALAKVKEAVTAGKSFEEAAKAAGLLEPKAITDLSTTRRMPPGATEPMSLFQDASKVDPGSFAELITDTEHAYVVRVNKREVVKDANPEASLASDLNSEESVLQTGIFEDWLTAKVEQAKVDQLYKRQ